MSTEANSDEDRYGLLRDLFGDYRAEWPPERFRDLFVKPAYFKKLETMRPSFLMGGRGTGKTTALRSLRFDATLQRLEAQGGTYGDQEYLGVFIRINKNRVHAFQGGGLDAALWRKAFAHYFNLLVSAELVEVALWLERQAGRKFSEHAVRAVCQDLALPSVGVTSELKSRIKAAVSELQLFVNNPAKAEAPICSIAEAPLRTFAEGLTEDLAEDRTIFCCIDEYENLLDDQQAVINTYIKHAEPPLSYKVGVRKNGLRNHQTLEGADLLRTPDDYEQIDIAQEGFEYFAEAVASIRLKRAKEGGVQVPDTLRAFLEELSLSEEAVLLGAGDVAANVVNDLKVDPGVHLEFAKRSSAETYFLRYWAECSGKSVGELAREWLAEPEVWRNRLNNYGYSSLFWLSVGRKGARIRKYYSGAGTFLTLPGGNIRYFLELLDTAIAEQLSEGLINKGELRLSAKAQTLAARIVAQRRLDQLEGLAGFGVELKRLVLAVGKVFFELARVPVGHSPEVTSFVLSGDGEVREKVVELLKDGVANLAFEATPRTKATTNREMRDDEYRLHPIFCAFFEISHRRKRRMTIRPEDLLLVLRSPSKAIAQMLQGVNQSDESELPEQLALFTSFFKGQ